LHGNRRFSILIGNDAKLCKEGEAKSFMETVSLHDESDVTAAFHTNVSWCEFTLSVED
jgi:hypothetical protein